MIRRKNIYVLGTALSHENSACLLKNGEVCFAIEKERITRKKHDGGNDSLAVQYCLDAEKIQLSDIDLVVQCIDSDRGEYTGARIISDHPRVVSISHHLAHAYSAIGTSPYSESAVFVVDGSGCNRENAIDLQMAIVPEIPLYSQVREKDSYYAFENGALRSVFKDFSPLGYWPPKNMSSYPTLHSIGGAYAGASKYIFGGMDDPGKLMGLAPYGRPNRHDFEIFDLRDERVFLNYDWMKEFNQPACNYSQLKENFQYYADIAFWIQSEVERALLYLINARYERFPHDNLAYAGGVALNVVANEKILRQTKFKNIYIQPAAGDNGLALGCAYYGWLNVLNQKRILHGGGSCFGKIYSHRTVKSEIEKSRKFLKVAKNAHPTNLVAKFLSEGKTVGWYDGASEFGPRALGHRSILADPRSSTVRDQINHIIKLREDFRPFAPSVMAEDAKQYFDLPQESPYMLMTAKVRKEWKTKIPSIVHKNGSARPQTVSKIENSSFWNLLHQFKIHSGVSVLLNTSMNRRRMPIVETPSEAVEFFLTSELDVLYLQGSVITKNQSAIEKMLVSLLAKRITKEAGRGTLVQANFLMKVHSRRIWAFRVSQGKCRVAAVRTQKKSGRIDLELRTLKKWLLGFESMDSLLQKKQIKIHGKADVNLGFLLSLENESTLF